MAQSIDADAILALPESLKETIPAYPAPPGSVDNLLNPPNNGPKTISAVAVFMAPALFFLLARLYTKVFLTKKLSWDDRTCVLGFVRGCDAVQTEGNHSFGAMYRSLRYWNQLAIYVASWFEVVFSMPAIGPVKIAIFLFYLQIFSHLKWFRIAVYVDLCNTVIYYLGISIAFVMSTPDPGQSMARHLLSPETLRQQDLLTPNAVIGLALDLYLFVLPIRAVMTLQLPRVQKVGVLLVFMTGLLILEAYVGIIAACMPSFAHLLKQHLPPFEPVRSIARSLANMIVGRSKNSNFHKFGSQEVTELEVKVDVGSKRDVERAQTEMEVEVERKREKGRDDAWVRYTEGLR